MPRHENPEVVGAVMALGHVGFSRQQISNILKERNVSMTKMGVHRLIARKKLDASGKKKTVTRLTNQKVRKSTEKSTHRQSQESCHGKESKDTKNSRSKSQGIGVNCESCNPPGFAWNLEKKVSSSRPFEQADQATSRARSAVLAVFGERRI